MFRDVLFCRVIKLFPFFYLSCLEQKQDAGFSVVFGNTGRSGSAGGRAAANVEWRIHELLVGGGGVRWHTPREICKIGISKMQFPAYPGPELVNRENLLRH